MRMNTPKDQDDAKRIKSQQRKRLTAPFSWLRRILGAVAGRLGRSFAAVFSWLRKGIGIAFRWLKKNPLELIGIISTLVLAGLTVGLTSTISTAHLWPIALFLILGILAGLILIGIPREKYPDIYVKTFGWLPVSLGLLSYPFWYWYSDQPHTVPASQFFEISAQVLPVLLLAAVIDVRRAENLKSHQLLLPIIAVFLGELAALNVLAFGEPGGEFEAAPADFAAVAASMVSTIIALVLAVLADLEKKGTAETSGRAR